MGVRIEGVQKLLKKEFQEYTSTNVTTSTINDIDSTYTEAFMKELKEEIIQEEIQVLEGRLEEAIIERESKSYIDKTKKLLYEGLLVAFFVGLAVNQATDIIGIFKGTVEKDYLNKTIICTVIIGAISLIVFMWKFIADIFEHIKNGVGIDKTAVKDLKEKIWHNSSSV